MSSPQALTKGLSVASSWPPSKCIHCVLLFFSRKANVVVGGKKFKWNFTPLVSPSERLPCRAFLTSLIRHIISSGKYNNYSRCLLFSIYFIPAYFVESLQRIYSPVWTMHYMKSFNTARPSALWLQLLMGHRMNWWCYTHLCPFTIIIDHPPSSTTSSTTTTTNHSRDCGRSDLGTTEEEDDTKAWKGDKWIDACDGRDLIQQTKRMGVGVQRQNECGRVNGMENWITALKSFPSVFRMPRHPYHHHHRHPMLFHWG